jgi:hypothetical protein
LVGCATISEAHKGTAIAKDICDLYPPITYDGKLDTTITKDQIKVFNQKRNAFCA